MESHIVTFALWSPEKVFKKRGTITTLPTFLEHPRWDVYAREVVGLPLYVMLMRTGTIFESTAAVFMVCAVGNK